MYLSGSFQGNLVFKKYFSDSKQICIICKQKKSKGLGTWVLDLDRGHTTWDYIVAPNPTNCVSVANKLTSLCFHFLIFKMERVLILTS